ncbi:sodium:solute symporter family transporter [Clostridium ganghwense]|uniref:Proline permease n=1 Tax=Clostridium ganghwense TaxID=312089 RepID=A0ABT4CVA9_9CLOT|nr:hypothetical protein [Clostridium ganghwense]MCY6372146.1 hypothetical protein [Clostridium ganghwense]
MGTIRVIIALYMVVVILIGFYAMKRTKDSTDFYAAGRSLGIISIAMASFSAAISGFVFVGGPGLFYKVGMGSLWLTFPTSISFAMCWIIMGKRMRLLTETSECVTAADAIYARYKSNNTRLLTAIATMVGLLLYLATQISALGFVIGPIFNISFKTAVVVGMIIVIIYSVAGGMLAGVYTDVFQGSMMAVASILIVIFALKDGGGTVNMSQALAGADSLAKGGLGAKMTGPWGALTPAACMAWFFCLSIGIVGQPHIVHKFYMLKDINKLRWGPSVAAIPGMLGGLFWIMIGLVVKYFATTGQLPKEAMELLAKSSDNTVVVYLNYYAPKLIAGMVYAGIASAVMSTADSFINIVSACIVKDIPAARGIKLTSKQELNYGRISVIILSILTIIISFTVGSKGVAVLGAFGWGTFAAALAPAFGIGLNWKRATSKGAFWSILIGLVGNVIFEVSKTLGAAWYVKLIKPLGIYNGALWMTISAIVFILVSYATQEEKIDTGVEAAMEA